MIVASSRPARSLSSLGLVLCLFLAFNAASAALIPASGDIRTFLTGIEVAGEGSEGFVEPSESDMATWKSAIASLLDLNITTAAALAGSQQYDLFAYTDTPSGALYYVLREQNSAGEPGFRGLGTYVLNPRARRLLNIQCPHPLYDHTLAQSCEIFLQTESMFLQISGATRCANSAPADCGFTTLACAPDSFPIPYRVSDAAHYLPTFFQTTSDEVAARISPLISVSVHRFGAACDPWEETSAAVISNGTAQFVNNSIATQLAHQYNLIFAGLPYTGEGGGSCNADPGDPDHWATSCEEHPPCGGSNVQGISLNSGGPPTDCSVLPPSPGPGEERFVHIEQFPILVNEWPTEGVSWQVTIDAIANTFDVDTWVDFTYVGPETGSFYQPFSSLAAAVANAGDHETIWIKAGSSNESPTIVQPHLLKSFNGSATIGQ